LHFHIRKIANGIVASAIGEDIRVGHCARLTGPFGSAFFRPNHTGRTVPGFAPIWSIAVAAIKERPQRALMLIVAARTLRSFYMHGALCRLAQFPNVTIIPVVSEPQTISRVFRSGRPTDYLPALLPDDVVYASGAPAMTQSVARIARDAGTRCYADPFVSGGKPSGPRNLTARVAGWLDSRRRNSEKLLPA
jgi:3-phenylpropionate/trans-cinnamate dioxygenase ferredoxin reductase subunit